jgi:hypothetical protein
MAPPAFSLLKDVQVLKEIQRYAWCPCYDLACVISEDTVVTIYRISWQKVSQWHTPQAVTAVAWNPDGKKIALGVDDGKLYVHDVESTRLLSSFTCCFPQPTPVEHLHWIRNLNDHHSASRSRENRSKSMTGEHRRYALEFCEKCDQSAPVARITWSESGLEETTEDEEDTFVNGASFSLLAALSDNNAFALFADGSVPLLSQILSPLNDPSTLSQVGSPLQLHTPSVWISGDWKSAAMMTAAGRPLSLNLVTALGDTAFLGVALAERARMQRALRHVQETFGNAHERLLSLRQSFLKLFSGASSLQLRTDFLLLLTTGAVSDPLALLPQQVAFLTKHLRLWQQFGTKLQDILHIKLIAQLQDAQSLCLRLLQTAPRAHHSLVASWQLPELLQALSALIAHTRKCSANLIVAMPLWEAFFSWCLHMARHLSQELPANPASAGESPACHMASVAEYLGMCLVEEPLEKLLKVGMETTPVLGSFLAAAPFLPEVQATIPPSLLSSPIDDPLPTNAHSHGRGEGGQWQCNARQQWFIAPREQSAGWLSQPDNMEAAWLRLPSLGCKVYFFQWWKDDTWIWLEPESVASSVEEDMPDPTCQGLQVVMGTLSRSDGQEKWTERRERSVDGVHPSTVTHVVANSHRSLLALVIGGRRLILLDMAEDEEEADDHDH